MSQCRLLRGSGCPRFHQVGGQLCSCGGREKSFRRRRFAGGFLEFSPTLFLNGSDAPPPRSRHGPPRLCCTDAELQGQYPACARQAASESHQFSLRSVDVGPHSPIPKSSASGIQIPNHSRNELRPRTDPKTRANPRRQRRLAGRDRACRRTRRVALHRVLHRDDPEQKHTRRVRPGGRRVPRLVRGASFAYARRDPPVGDRGIYREPYGRGVHREATPRSHPDTSRFPGYGSDCGGESSRVRPRTEVRRAPRQDARPQGRPGADPPRFDQDTFHRRTPGSPANRPDVLQVRPRLRHGQHARR